jgi:2-C-methyl-D-erythritol 4-phosphate cytidylyltransferase
MSSSPETWAVIVAAGRGLRFESGAPKQFASLAGRPIALWALEPFRGHPAILGVTLVVPRESATRPPEWLAQSGREGVRIVEGGTERTDSVRLGLETVPEDATLVAVHDGARPLISAEAITQVITAAGPDKGAVAARRVTDSLKRGDAQGRVTGSVDRESLWRAETPQIFPRALIIDVHRRAEAEGVSESDCAGLCQRYGIEIDLVEIEGPNPKITRPEDLAWAEAWVARHETGAAERRGS